MLTHRQAELLAYIRTCQTDRGFTPSVREMAAFLGTASMSTAYRLLEELEARRFIRTTRSKARSVVVLRTEIPTMREEELAAQLAAARQEIVRLTTALDERAGELVRGVAA